MSVLVYGMDTDNPPYWYGWTVTGVGHASGFVDPDYRAEFFEELKIAAQSGKIIVGGGDPRWPHRTSDYVLDTDTGKGWHAYNAPSWPVWSYAGTDPAMSLYRCCANPLTVVVDTLYEFWHWEDGNETVAHPGTMGIGPAGNAWGAGQTSTAGGAEGTSYASGLGNDQGSQDVAAVAGTSYLFSGWFHRFNEDVRIEVLWYDAAGALLQTDLIAYNSFWPVGWNAWDNTLTAPTSAANMQLRARTEASGGVGATGWIDQVRIYVVG